MEKATFTSESALYDSDYFTWKQRQAEHIRLGRLFCVDFDNIAEEIGSLGKSQQSELTSRYKVL